MSIRTVRLDDDAESTLAAIRQRTGLSISDVLKRGLEAYAASIHDEMTGDALRSVSPARPGSRRRCRGSGQARQDRGNRDDQKETQALILAGVGPLGASFAPELFGVY